MRRGIVVPVVAVMASLVLPGRAQAIDHVVLFVSPTKLTASPTTKAKNPKPNRLAGWKLSPPWPARRRREGSRSSASRSVVRS